MWNVLTTEQDAKILSDLFGDFHDGCIREAHVWTETSVAQNLTMTCPTNLDTHVRIYFQRQFASPSAIELLFDEVVGMQLTSSPDDSDSIIWSASISFETGVFYWRDGSGKSWIGGKKLKWRDVSSWMGDTIRYGQKMK